MLAAPARPEGTRAFLRGDDMRTGHGPFRTRAASLVMAGAAITALAGVAAQAPPDRCLVPPPVREAILDELSGEQVRLHVQMLSANRNREAAEYAGRYFEADTSPARPRAQGCRTSGSTFSRRPTSGTPRRATSGSFSRCARRSPA